MKVFLPATDSSAAVASIQLVPKYIKSESNVQIFRSETIKSSKNGGLGAHVSNAAFHWGSTNSVMCGR